MGVGEDFEPFAQACGVEIEAPDLIGHGIFQCDDPTQYSLDAQLTYWENRIAKGSILIGYSMGGRLALQFACRYPERLAGLVLIGATPGIRHPLERTKRQQWDRRQAEHIRDMGVEQFYQQWQQLPIIATQQRIDLAIQMKMKVNRLTQSIEGLVNSMTHFGTGTMSDCWEALPSLNMPILLMVGEEDAKYRGIANQMIDRLPEGTVDCVVISGAGHCVHLEQISESADVFKQWLQRQVNGCSLM